MRRLRSAFPFLLAMLAGCARAGTAGLPPSPVAPASLAGPASKIRHVVIIFQENRTPDNLFNGLPGADTVLSGLNSKGQSVPLKPISITAPYDLGHTHDSFWIEYNGGKLNGFNNNKSSCLAPIICIPEQQRAYGYVPHNEIKPYFIMATRYAFGDHMFQTNQGPSFPAHQYIVSGTSAIANGSTLRASENPFRPSDLSSGGCNSPPGSLVQVIDAAGSENQKVYPCFNRISLMELLDDKGLTWRYYQATPGAGIWNGPDAVLRIVESRGFSNEAVAPPAQILTDVANGNLADVSWVTPTALASDHALDTNGTGPSWVAAVVNAIGESKYWNDTAIIVTWDDWGGWYDHVPPIIYNSYELGFRVPLLVISPYAKPHYVSHVEHEFGSILKFAEKVFGLPSMHTTDARSDDLSDCFDFTQAPTPFKPIPAPYPPSYFFTQPSTEPDD
ncbi:MAG TPA: alkaline phosphatase family protein [Candidatus Babeliales bacterium]|nr:alkaline phosphatase family protein [Candidatus Babeliales bacterium]